MFEVLKKSLSLIDCLIIIAGFYWIGNMTYEDFSTSGKIYIAVFAIWLIMLFIRIFIVYKNGGGKK